MLNRYARVDLDHRNNGVDIQRWGRFYAEFYSNVTASSHARLKRIIDNISLIKGDAKYSAYEWQPPTLHLIPYQCSNCNEIVWSTNDALYIRHYCESVEELLEMVRKS